MYTDEDLNLAIKKGVFTKSSVKEFRNLILALKGSSSVDEEHFKLIGRFNDTFIVIACALLLFSSLWILKSINDSLGFIVFTVLSWYLSQFFIFKKKMALPAIFLTLSFVGGVFALFLSFFFFSSEEAFIAASVASIIAAYVHWSHFKVPITIAAGTVAILGLLVSIVFNIFPDARSWMLLIMLICGLASFSFAMYWDSSDRNRKTRRSDVAYWLHFLAAPLIIHPVVSHLGVLSGDESISNMIAIVILYMVMTSISIIIDRRVFMVSSLLYMLYVITVFINTFGGIGYSFALMGVVMGATLLLLSAFWRRIRRYMFKVLPDKIKNHIPKVDAVYKYRSFYRRAN